MQRILYAYMTALLLVIAYTGPLCAAQGAAPKIEAAELSFDLGNVVQGTEASHEFVFRNAGSAELVIEQVQPS